MRNLISVIHAWVTTRTTDDRGATMAEYGLLVALIAAFLIGTVQLLGGGIDNTFQQVVDALPSSP